MKNLVIEKKNILDVFELQNSTAEKVSQIEDQGNEFPQNSEWETTEKENMGKKN
jgi:hypothetical protein